MEKEEIKSGTKLSKIKTGFSLCKGLETNSNSGSNRIKDYEMKGNKIKNGMQQL